MGETLFGGEKSGTPIETRELTKDYANRFQRGDNPLGNVGVNFISQLFGFDPKSLGLGDVAMDLLGDPGDRTSGLFAAMEPFEAQETARQTAGLRNIFGTMGGRFSRNVGEAEGDLRGRLAAEFGRNREQALLQANSQRIQALAQILGLSQPALGAGNQVLGFMNPGAPNWREGIFGDIAGAAGTAIGMKAFGG